EDASGREALLGTGHLREPLLAAVRAADLRRPQDLARVADVPRQLAQDLLGRTIRRARIDEPPAVHGEPAHDLADARVLLGRARRLRERVRRPQAHRRDTLAARRNG